MSFGLPRILATVLVLPAALAGQTLSAPAEVNAGASVSIAWSGPPGERDFITIVPADTPAGVYRKYKYLSNGSPVELLAPDQPGSYLVRWMSGAKGYPTRASQPLQVLPVSAGLDAPAQVDAGGRVTVSWQGPDNPRDFITLVPKGTPERQYKRYAYTSSGNPVELPVPDVAGDYEIRYLTGQDYLTLTARPLTVGGVTASLRAKTQLAAGETFSVEWEGPDNPRDFITLVPKGTPERQYKRYVYTSAGNPGQLQAPDEPGEYEIRYLTGQDYRTLATLAITVGDVSASLAAPDQVEGGTMIPIEWQGPDNPRDFITIVPAGEADGKWMHYVYTNHGSPLDLKAPLEAGDYELRYVTGQAHLTLAARPIRVGPPANAPGALQVLPASSAVAPGSNAPSAGPGGAVEIILDASGSMLQRQGGQRRIDIAKATLAELTRSILPAGTPFALRVFGHREAGSCRSDLEVPLAPLDPGRVAGLIGGIEAMNLAKTPIAASLTRVLQDLRGSDGDKTVVLITDGEETCEGDPAAAIEALRAAGVDVRVNIVGFAIDDEDLKGQFRYWADLGGGGYFDATDADSLGQAVTAAVRAPWVAIGTDGSIAASGIVGGPPVALPSGTYVVRVRGTPPRTIPGVLVEPGETARVE